MFSRKLAFLPAVLLFAALSTFPLHARQSFDDAAARQAIRERLDSVRKTRPTVGLVLSGGAAKGAAHVGVIRYIEELGIPVDLVVGTSMGGLVGGIYALGYSPAEISSVLSQMDWDQVMNDRIPYEQRNFMDSDYRDKFILNIAFEGNPAESIQLGRTRGMYVENTLSSLAVGYEDSTMFARLPIPFACVAVDLVKDREKVWYGGKLSQAMRSTMSIAGVFTPVEVGQMILVDGGMLNNYPADVARDLGADIMIGVDVSMDYNSYDKVRNPVGMVSKVFNISHRKDLAALGAEPDVNIRPDMTGAKLMGFTKEGIEDMVQRGYVAANGSREALLRIKEKVGVATKALGAPQARNLFFSSVPIQSYEISGVHDKDLQLVRRIAALDGATSVDEKGLNAMATRLYSSKAFTSVNYELLGGSEPYRLRINCEDGPDDQIGVGLRVDSEEIIAALLSYGIKSRRLSGPAAVLSAKIGLNPFADAHLYYRPRRGPLVNLSLSANFVNMSRLFNPERTDMSLSFSNLRQEIYLSESAYSPARWKLALRNDWYNLKTITMSGATLGQWGYEGQKTDVLSALAEVKFDSFDDRYFPTSGNVAFASYEYVLHCTDSLWKENSKGTHILSIKAGAALSAGKFTFIPMAWARMVTGESIPLSLNNVIGGYMESRYLDQQIPFVGVSGLTDTRRYLAVGRMDLRYSFTHKSHLSAIANAFYSASDFSSDALVKKGWGCALEYAYRTFFGPIRAQVNYSDVSEKVGFYISFGLDF